MDERRRALPRTAGRPAERQLSEALAVEVPGSGAVSALFDRPPGGFDAFLVLAHGAGAGMRHAFMEGVALRLAERGVAVFRYQFPYIEAGRRRVDRPEVAARAVAAAVAKGGELSQGAPLFAGGKSFGGRMTSTAAAGGGLDDVGGLVFFGFPLHPAGKPGTSRADHLADVPRPQLYLQGTRDALADLDLLRGVVGRLGERATVHVVEGADHGFHVLKRSGRTDDDVLDELADVASSWMTQERERCGRE